MNMPSFVDSFTERPRKSFEPNKPVQKMVPPQRTVTPPLPQLTRRLSNMQQANARGGFAADNPEDIKIGVEVEHQRFGRGRVLEIEGDQSNLKATVLFQNAGRKQLLLKFARLKVVG